MLLVLAVAAGLWLLFELQGVILLVLLSMLFAYLIAPVVEFLCRPVTWGPRSGPCRVHSRLRWSISRCSHPWASPAMSCCRFSARRSRNLAGRFPPIWPTRATTCRRGSTSSIPIVCLEAFATPSIERLLARSTRAGDSLSHGFGGLLPLLGYLPWFILIPVVAFFLLKDGAAFRRDILLTLPRGRLRGRGAEVFEDINDALAAYMRAALLACLLVGVLCTIGFVLIGVPYALLFGVIGGLLEFIPLVGPLVVALGATLVTSFHSINQALWVVAFLGALRLAQDYVVFPRLVRRGIHMHPLGVILAILSGAELAGVAGIFLAVPAVAVLSVMHRHLLEYRGSGGLVSELLTPTASAPDQARRMADPAATPIACPPPDAAAPEPDRTAAAQ